MECASKPVMLRDVRMAVTLSELKPSYSVAQGFLVRLEQQQPSNLTIRLARLWLQMQPAKCVQLNNEALTYSSSCRLHCLRAVNAVHPSHTCLGPINVHASFSNGILCVLPHATSDMWWDAREPHVPP